MNSHIFVLIRYSVLSRKSPQRWTLSHQNDFEGYRAKLFDEKRLSLHEYLFENVTIPSLDAAVARAPINVTALVLTADTLPEPYRGKLEEIAAHRDWMTILPATETDPYLGMFEEAIRDNMLASGAADILYATVRLDDDDALSNDFLENLGRHIIPENAGHAVSFPAGYKMYFEGNQPVSLGRHHYPKNAQGLTFLGKFDRKNPNTKTKTIFSFGKHSNIDEKIPLILDSGTRAYVWSIHEESDLTQRRPERMMHQGPETSFETLEHEFTFSGEFSKKLRIE